MSLLAQARKDLLRRAADPWSLLGWLAVPLLVGSLITAVTGGGSKPQAHLLVADLDGSFASSVVSSALGSDQLDEIVRTEKVELEEGRLRIEAGEATGLLVIPAGFGDRFLLEEPQTLELWTNPSQRILPQILVELLDLLADADFYAHRIFGPELASFAGGGSAVSEADASTLGASIQVKMQKLSPLLQPMPIEVEVVRPAGEGQRASFALLLFPGIALMAALFTAQGLVEDLWTERELGTLRRLATTSDGGGVALAGKILAGAGVLLLVGAAVLAPGFAYHRIPWLLFGPALLFLTLSGIVLYQGLALIQLLAPSRRAGILLSQMLVFPLLMVGGSFFPSEALPGGVAAIGGWTPNGFMTERLKELLVDGGLPELVGPSLVLALAGLVLFGVLRTLWLRFARI